MRVLARAGYRVTGVRDGLDAWHLFHRNPDRFDLAFVDVILPRLHGPRLGGRIRKMRPTLPILYTSGFTPFGQPPHLASDARIGFLAKPYGPRTLLRFIRAMLDPGRAPGARA